MKQRGIVAIFIGIIFFLAQQGDVLAFVPRRFVRAPAVGDRTTGVVSRKKEVVVVFKQAPNASTLLSVQNQARKVAPRGAMRDPRKMVYTVEEGTIEEALSVLASNPNVQTVFPNYRFRLFLIPNDPAAANLQWNMFNLQTAGAASSAWDRTTGSSAITIAVIDSGIDSAHPDFSGKIAGLAQCLGAACSSVGTMSDPVGHGTHVAGIAAAATNNSSGVAGAGYNTKILGIKVTDDTGSANFSDVENAIRYAADQGVRVINMSLGAPEQELDAAAIASLNEAVAYAWNRNVVIVAAAGNCGDGSCGYTNPKNYPAASPNVLSVAALGVDNALAGYSERNDAAHGNWISVAAPGGDGEDPAQWILSSMSFPNAVYAEFAECPIAIGSLSRTRYCYLLGTSMASPHVAGVAALVIARNTALTNAQVKSILETTGEEGVEPGKTNYGAVNALAAVDAAILDNPTPTVTPGQTPTLTVSSTCTTGNIPAAHLSWTPVTGVSGYDFFKCTGSGCNPTYYGGTTELFFDDTSVTVGGTYGYKIRGYFPPSGYSPFSNTAYVTIASCAIATPTRTPTPPAASVTAIPTATPGVSVYPTTGPAVLPKTPPDPYPTGPYCVGELLACSSHKQGDANCDASIDEKDFKYWEDEYDTIRTAIPPQNANFFCAENDAPTRFVDLLDFEVWRRHTTFTSADTN